MNQEKIADLKNWMHQEKIDFTYISDPGHIAYFSGYESEPHERVLALFIAADDQSFLFTPALEVEDAEKSSWTYPVYGYLDSENPWEKIAFVSGALIDPINGQNRMKGYKEALAENGLSYNEGLVFESEYKFKAGINLAERVRNSGATAAFVTDDELAIGLLDGMLDAGVKVPEEFEIITSNNSLLTEVSRPRLSSITQPLYDIGAVSMRLLTKLMNKEEIEEKTVVLPYGIDQKGSTK